MSDKQNTARLHGYANQGNEPVLEKWKDIGNSEFARVIYALSSMSLADSPSIDAFGRLRVANNGLRADVEFTYDAHPSVMETITSGGATITHNSDTRDVTLSIVNANDGTIATFPLGFYVPYTPGCSQRIDMTGTLDLAAIEGGTASVFIRNNGVDTVIDQEDWLYSSKADDVDWTKSQIFSFDFQSLKVGRIRFALIRNGVEVILHEVYNDNMRSHGYWQHPNLPINWRIYNSGGNTISEIGYFDTLNGFGFRYTIPANANATMLAICGTVKSEGGQDLLDMGGFMFGANMGATTKTVSSTLIPLLSIQLKTTFNSLPNRAFVIAKNMSTFTDQPIIWELVRNGTLTNPSFSSVDDNSLCNYDVAATAISGGRMVGNGYSGGAAKITATDTNVCETCKVPMSLNYAGDQGDILTIAARKADATDANVAVALGWKEIR